MTVDEIVTGIEQGMVSDGGADYIMMLESMGLLGRIFSVLSGFMVALIVIGIPIVIALEVMYINLPFAQSKIDGVIINTQGRIKDALEFTIKDAKTAMVQANTLQTGGSVNRIYLGIKMKAVFIAAFIIGLVLGGGPLALRFLWSITTGILNGFNGM